MAHDLTGSMRFTVSLIREQAGRKEVSSFSLSALALDFRQDIQGFEEGGRELFLSRHTQFPLNVIPKLPEVSNYFTWYLGNTQGVDVFEEPHSYLE